MKGKAMKRGWSTTLGIVAVVVVALVAIVVWPAPDPLADAETVYLQPAGSSIEIVAKIQSRIGYHNYPELNSWTDAYELVQYLPNSALFTLTELRKGKTFSMGWSHCFLTDSFLMAYHKLMLLNN